MPRPDRHRPQLLEAAGDSLRRRGLAATSTAEILRAAGATNGSLYHHFPGGKPELARAALVAAADRIERQLRRAVGGSGGVAPGIDAWLGALITAVERDPLDGCPVAPAAVEAAATDPDLRAATAAVFARWAGVLADALRSPERDAEAAATLARAVLSLIEGALLLDRVAGGTEHLRAVRATVRALLTAGHAETAAETP